MGSTAMFTKRHEQELAEIKALAHELDQHVQRSLERLEQIIERLDSGQAGLRETLDLCREGRELVTYCAAELDAVGEGLKELRLDCDEDAILALVEPAGPACHTGERTCFHKGELDPVPAEALAVLERTIAERHGADTYTGRLLADRELVAAKVQEEAEEVARAARDESDERLSEEAADVLYHLAVLMAERGLGLTDAYRVLNERRRG